MDMPPSEDVLKLNNRITELEFSLKSQIIVLDTKILALRSMVEFNNEANELLNNLTSGELEKLRKDVGFGLRIKTAIKILFSITKMLLSWII